MPAIVSPVSCAAAAKDGEPVQRGDEDGRKDGKESAPRHSLVPRVTGQQAQETQMAAVVGEQGHGDAVVETCGEQVLPPRPRLGEGHPEAPRPARELEPVQAQRLDLVVGLREREVTGQRVDVPVRADPAVDARLGVANPIPAQPRTGSTRTGTPAGPSSRPTPPPPLRPAPSTGSNGTRGLWVILPMDSRSFECLHEGGNPPVDASKEDIAWNSQPPRPSPSPPEEVYGFWSRLDRFPSFMAHVDDVQVTGPRTSHWKVSAPFDREVEWDAETTEQIPGSRLAWRSIEGADVANSGEVRFVPAPDGASTEVHVTLTLRRARRWAGEGAGQVLRRGPVAASRRRPPPVQAGHGDRSGGALRRSPVGQARAPGVPATPRAATVRRRAEGAAGMKANCWIGPNKVEVQDVPDPSILNARDAIVRITSTAICGSDLHLLDGYVPTMQEGDVMGHEFMGEVVEVGPGVDASKLRVGDRVVVPFPIACGACAACRARAVLLLREQQPQRRHRREDVRPSGGRDLRLLAPHRRLRRRPGRVRPGALRRRQPAAPRSRT